MELPTIQFSIKLCRIGLLKIAGGQHGEKKDITECTEALTRAVCHQWSHLLYWNNTMDRLLFQRK